MSCVDTPPLLKVYCRTCRYFLDAQRSGQRRCLHPHARYWVDTSVAREQRYLTPDARNGHNDCLDFRPARLWERMLAVDPWAFLGVSILVLVLMLNLWFFLRR
jgi:hypothetical protein